MFFLDMVVHGVPIYGEFAFAVALVIAGIVFMLIVIFESLSPQVEVECCRALSAKKSHIPKGRSSLDEMVTPCSCSFFLWSRSQCQPSHLMSSGMRESERDFSPGGWECPLTRPSNAKDRARRIRFFIIRQPKQPSKTKHAQKCIRLCVFTQNPSSLRIIHFFTLVWFTITEQTTLSPHFLPWWWFIRPIE